MRRIRNWQLESKTSTSNIKSHWSTCIERRRVRKLTLLLISCSDMELSIEILLNSLVLFINMDNLITNLIYFHLTDYIVLRKISTMRSESMPVKLRKLLMRINEAPLQIRILEMKSESKKIHQVKSLLIDMSLNSRTGLVMAK